MAENGFPIDDAFCPIGIRSA